MQNYQWTILYSDHAQQFIHSEFIKQHNPNASLFLLDISNQYSKEFAWKNSDLLIRNWLKENISKINPDSNIAILEWDVFLNTSLPNIKVDGLMGKYIFLRDKHPGWHHWRYIDLLKDYKQYAVGAMPFGVYFINYRGLECWIDHKHDCLYDQNIKNELRLPSLLNSENIKIENYNLPYVCYQTKWTNFAKPGIYHPVKHSMFAFL